MTSFTDLLISCDPDSGLGRGIYSAKTRKSCGAVTIGPLRLKHASMKVYANGQHVIPPRVRASLKPGPHVLAVHLERVGDEPVHFSRFELEEVFE